MKKSLSIVLCALTTLFTGCATTYQNFYNWSARQELITGTQTIFLRMDDGGVKKLEMKQTELGRLIGPDGYAFKPNTSPELLKIRYGYLLK